MMAKKRNISKQVTKRVLDYMDAAIAAGVCEDYKAFAAAAGMPVSQLNLIRGGDPRYFTIDQLCNLGKRFNLDMNYFLYGAGTPVLPAGEGSKVSDILKQAILALEAAESQLEGRNKKTEQKRNKSHK
jgi:hypothetical protein